FANAVVPVPLTLPSHATMMTSLYPASHGVRVNGLSLPDDPPTLAELLRGRGYETAAFLASQALSRTFGIDRGFDFYDDGWMKEDTRSRTSEDMQRRGDVVVGSFLRWLEAREETGPFFAWVHFYDPHQPYDPPPDFLAAAGGDVYAGEVAFADRQFGRVLAALDSIGAAENTIVAVIGDHGEGLGDHGEESHGFLLYETTVAVPWVLRFPGSPRGLVVNAPVESVDLLPTVAELLSLNADPSWQGRSLIPLFAAGAYPENRPQYTETVFGNVTYNWSPLYSLREGDWKLVRGSRTELFDLASDPAEKHDLASEQPDVVLRLRRELEEECRAQEEASAGEVEMDLTADQEDMLVALGYLVPNFPVSESDTLPHPVDLYPAHALLVRAERLSADGEFEAAESLFARARVIDPRNLYVLESYATLFRKQGKFAEEENLLRALLAVDPKHAPTWNNLGNVMLRTGGSPDAALTCFYQAVESDSTYAFAYVNLGNTRLNAGDIDQAIRYYDKAIKYRPDLVPAYFGKAIAYRNRGDFEKQVEALKATLDIDSGFEPARRMLPSYKPSSAGPGGSGREG
ncbi:MAG: sulfatase-like hydrolase/transferase, partial [Candidatus Eisenbacteria bacterium]